MWYNTDMSRTYKDNKKNKRYRLIRDSFIKKITHRYSDMIVGRKKDRKINHQVRARLKELLRREER